MPIRDIDIAATFRKAEQAGLRVALKGRLIAIAIIGTFFVLSRMMDPDIALGYLIAFSGFFLLGALHLKLLGSRFDCYWVKYIFVTIDFAVFAALMATQKVYQYMDLPVVMNFRLTYFPFLYLVLAMAAFSLSPWLVLWAGGVGVVAWLGAWLWAIRDMPVRFDWQDIGAQPDKETFLYIFFNENFIGLGSRVQESIAFLIVAVLISMVIWRARNTVFRQLELDQERQTITEVFSQYVPEEIANALIADKGLLEPVEREATVLFVDIAGFTKMTEDDGPQRIVRVLNEYFDGATAIISRHQGVVTSFIGDAIMATFNLPVEDPDHARHAIDAAHDILALVERARFDGKKLDVRIGLSTGPVIGGSIGGAGRQSYTVYGDTVNLASRLEGMNKEQGTRLLMTETTVEAAGHQAAEKVGELPVRGLARPVSVFRSSASSPSPSPIAGP
ncbi:adenylate/guanylate cyclase domain-containing protein [Sneathiella chinensis]|uniref:Guanylate cyclase domain-containing protein n=1 Tax=Sneathiella chinensis TaxID=349750 RepID=A0ABQ5U5M9_9PROT|nr:adenylate/guanylate cyclase domain-containing protein [Sneathiella chinensis]GLQ06490.1 hypothetical protein GCM10007924_17110 [Sneathiella chinensis]